MITQGRLSKPYAGPYSGFNISCAGIVYRGIYLGMLDFLQSAMLKDLQDNFFATFVLGWSVATGGCLASYQFDIVLCCMMMTSGAVATFLLGCSVVTGGCLASYPIDIVLR
jgi:solute carrier family 25 (mitochondrial adenine nucleotide translocator), member 4/5/6/31